MRLVVGDDPREDGVLVEVVVRASRHRVEVHQVVEVGDLTSLPLLHHARHLEELLRRRHRHAPASVTSRNVTVARTTCSVMLQHAV